MVNRAAGEIYKTSSILAQTFGETVATAFGLVFYQKIRRQTLSGAGKRGGNRRRQTLRLSGRRLPSKDRPGNVLAQGLVEKTGLVVAVGGLVYVSPNLARRADTDPCRPDAEDPAGRVSRPRQIRSTSGPCGAPGRATP